MRPITTDLGKGELRGRPYFLWDEDLSIDELSARLRGEDERERLRLLAKLLREARDTDVWEFVSPEEVVRALPRIRRRLGRRRAFWEFLIEGWREDGILTCDRLTPLQRAVLPAFFEVQQRFFLTGGAALAAFYLHHRETADLDLFTIQPAHE